MQKRIEVGSETCSDQLNVSTFDGHHERSDTRIRKHIVLQLFDLRQDIEGFQVARPASEMDGSAAIVVRLVDIRLQFQHFLDVICASLARHEHQGRYIAIHDWFIDWK